MRREDIIVLSQTRERSLSKLLPNYRTSLKNIADKMTPIYYYPNIKGANVSANNEHLFLSFSEQDRTYLRYSLVSASLHPRHRQIYPKFNLTCMRGLCRMLLITDFRITFLLGNLQVRPHQ